MSVNNGEGPIQEPLFQSIVEWKFDSAVDHSKIQAIDANSGEQVFELSQNVPKVVSLSWGIWEFNFERLRVVTATKIRLPKRRYNPEQKTGKTIGSISFGISLQWKLRHKKEKGGDRRR